MILRAVAVALWALATAFVLPGIVAASGDVFSPEGVARKLSPSTSALLSQFELAQRRRNDEVARIDGVLVRPVTDLTPEILATLLQRRQELYREIANSTSPITTIAFFPNSQTLMLPALYASLGWLIVLFRPPRFLTRRRASRAIIVASAAIYIFYDWPLWVRNFVLSNQGRHIYAYTNADIYFPSFLMQELNILGFSLLLGTLWYQWTAFYAARREELSNDSRKPLEIALDTRTWERLSETFTRWQACSLILAIGFLFATNFYWTIESKSHDARYQISAIAIHLLWGLTWITISAPLVATLRASHRVRVAALSSLLEDPEVKSEHAKAVSTFLSGIHPLSPVTVFVSAFSALTSFAAPLVKVLVT